jgi:DNA repair photolyase
MQDPFSPFEKKYQVSLQLMDTLLRHDYPTIISTKSGLVLDEPYISRLRDMNALVRISAAGVSESRRLSLEVGCLPNDKIFRLGETLARNAVATSLRIQPVIPGFEEEALRFAALGANSGFQHVSFEHLKVGIEGKAATIARIEKAVRKPVWQEMQLRGIKRLGRDYTLRTKAKRLFLEAARNVCRAAGVSFGAGDTEFIHHSDGAGCCNGSSLFLRNATQFTSNFVGVLKNKRVGDLIVFDELNDKWSPLLNMHQYLTTNSRARAKGKRFSSWTGLIAHRWNGRSSPYSPSFFFGVQETGDRDRTGLKIYRLTDSLAEPGSARRVTDNARSPGELALEKSFAPTL